MTLGRKDCSANQGGTTAGHAELEPMGIAPAILTVPGPDGLKLHVQVWNGGDRLPPVLCLPGLVRTGGDFADLAAAIGAGRQIVTLDYAGRGDSSRSPNIRRYGPIPCLRDVMAVCAATRLQRAFIVGTSFGGLLAMGLAAIRPSLVRAVVLNDIGPDIGTEGVGFVRDFIGYDPALDSLDACASFLRERLPPLSLRTVEDWRRMAALTYRQGADGRYHPLWDTRIAEAPNHPPAWLWLLFLALTRFPTLLLHGELSNILLPATVEQMRKLHSRMRVLPVPGVGHAPTLLEPEVLGAIRSFLDANT